MVKYSFTVIRKAAEFIIIDTYNKTNNEQKVLNTELKQSSKFEIFIL